MIPVIHLFPKLNSLLIELLVGLSPAQWENSTLCKKWNVKDIAAHLLDTALRRISTGRDNHFGKAPEINNSADLLNYINILNNDWVKAYKRISSRVLVKQLIQAHEEFYEHLLTLDLNSPALFPVSWAGEPESQTWFDIAREYTVQWLNQQQIRTAVGARSILDRELYYPFLDISMRALPFHYQSINAAEGTVLTITIVGDAGGNWTIIRNRDAWHFTTAGANASTNVYIDQNIAWILLSKGIDILEAEQYWQVAGDYELGLNALKMTSFIV